jgi:hypothetical protein
MVRRDLRLIVGVGVFILEAEDGSVRFVFAPAGQT